MWGEYKPFPHAEDCDYAGLYSEAHVIDGYDATGVKYRRCFGCWVTEHDPLVMKEPGYIGTLSEWPAGRVPPGHESGLLDFGPFVYSRDYTYNPPMVEKLPVVPNPVPIAFHPINCLGKNDGKDHEGVSFRELWIDPIAR